MEKKEFQNKKMYGIMMHDRLSQVFMVKMQVYIEEEVLQELKQIAIQENISYAALIRNWIKKGLDNKNEKIAKKKKNWVKEMAKYATPMGGNVSQRIDDILYGGENL